MTLFTDHSKVTKLPHPFDLEVQEFSSYALIIDARSPREFAEDHVPGATNLPVVYNEEYAEVGTIHRTDTHRAYVIGVGYSLRNIAEGICKVISGYRQNQRMMVYCFRGGKRSKLWADNLRTIGYHVDILPGGWKAYRRWVLCALNTIPRTFSYRVLTGPTGAGKTRLLRALSDAGEQVLDLERLANHRGSLIGGVPGQTQPSQKAFDSALVDTLRHFSQDRPVWIEAESRKIGEILLPSSLLDAMHVSQTFRINAPMELRVRLWHEDYPHFAEDPQGLMTMLYPLKPLVGKEEIAAWQKLADDREMSALFARLMVNHYDPSYERSTKKNFLRLKEAQVVHLGSLDPESLQAFARKLINS